MTKTAPASELAWKLADYQAAGVTPPERIIDNPTLTEGEMMTAEEIEEYVKDSLATLRILSDQGSDRFDALADQFRVDLAYLASVGMLDDEDYEDLLDENNLRF